MEEFEIHAEKRIAVICDNATKMVLCAELLSDNPSWGSLLCGAHLQLCINAALKQDLICRTIAAGRCLVGNFKKSAKATTALTEKQKQQKVAEHKLIQDVLTGWNSTYSMLEHLLEQRWPVSAVLSDPGTTQQSDRDLDLHRLGAEAYDHSHRAALAGCKCISVCHAAHANKYEENKYSTTAKALRRKLTEEIDKRWELTGSLEISIYCISKLLS
ncbi:Zinc finger BED domain-containing protein 4 [Merluccius polli]|uniref:Zinc finger BED domain-containing protein 4 n=1 Tax=Merluccius polli TaxID=89951 RepID=A0AA47N9J0_MERPO|nr:Zinc finger BED domain-containing protein 4 [Merluccius polli]